MDSGEPVRVIVPPWDEAVGAGLFDTLLGTEPRPTIEPPANVYIEGHDQPEFVVRRLDGDFRDVADALGSITYPVSSRAAGLRTRSWTFGSRQRLAAYGHEGCAPMRFNALYRKLYQRLSGDVLAAAERFYRDVRPDVFARHRAAVEGIHPAWRLSGQSVFTSGILNRDLHLGVHRDGANFPDTWNVQIVFSRDIRGGELVHPASGLAFAMDDHTIIGFNAQRAWHGVAPLQKIRRDAYRVSCVYYSLRSLCHCEEPELEMRRAQRLRTLRERRIAGIDA